VIDSLPTPGGSTAPPAWIPLSGLAITSFVLSLVFFVIAFLGLWAIEIIPLALAVYTLLTVKAGKRRGRMLAIWAVVISLSAGSCTFVIHQSARSVFGGITESLLSALSSKESAENQAEALKPWAWSEALGKNPDLVMAWRERYAQAEQAYGPWTGELELPSILLGGAVLFVPPEDITEIGTGKESPREWVRGAVVWTPAAFERGLVHVAVVFQDGGANALRGVQEQLQPGQQVPIVGDLRFFEVKAEKAE